MRPLNIRDFVRYFWLVVLWPWPVGLIIAIFYYEHAGQSERVQKLNSSFDRLTRMSVRIADVAFQSVFNPNATPTNTNFHPPGWWVASDGNWYPPELHPDRMNPPPHQ